MRKINYLLIPVLLVVVAACSSSPATEVPEEIAELENLTVVPADAEPSNDIDFKREAVYGDTEDVMLGSIMSVAVDQEGRVFIADGDQNYIHAYESDGTHMQQVASEGEGPGEFGNISRLKADEEYLYGYDRNKRQVNVFQLESLEFSHTVPLLREDIENEELSGVYPSGYYLCKDGTLLVNYNQPFRPNEDDEEEDRMNLFYRVDKEGNIVSDKIFEQKVDEYLMDRTDNNAMIVMPSPFGRKSLLSLSNSDQIYSAWTEEFLVKIHDSDGSYEGAIYYPYQKSELDLSEVLEDYEGDRPRRMLRNTDVPPTWPALNSLMVDDKNRMWISTITDDQDVYDWWIISEEGELQAQFTWPRNRSLLEVKNGVAYTEETDEATGLEQVVRYNVELS